MYLVSAKTGIGKLCHDRAQISHLKSCQAKLYCIVYYCIFSKIKKYNFDYREMKEDKNISKKA